MYCDQFLDEIQKIALPHRYTRIYISLCRKAASRAASKKDAQSLLNCRIESHHVLPKSFKILGMHEPNNLVHFTPREHFFAHLLLSKIFSNIRYRMLMISALVLLCSTGKFKNHTTSRIYEKLRTEFCEIQSKRASNQWAVPGAKAALSQSARDISLKPAAVERSRKAAEELMNDPDARKRVSVFQKGRIGVVHPISLVEKRILLNEFSQYEAQGFVKGRRTREERLAYKRIVNAKQP